MGIRVRDWQDTETVLSYFGRRKKEAVLLYERFVQDGIAEGRRPELIGGGLIRSLGGWSQVLSLRRKGLKIASDERILGSSEFVESLLMEAEMRERETLRLSELIPSIKSLAEKIADGEGITSDELRSASKKRQVANARKLFCQLAVGKMRYPGAEVARFLGVTSSAVNRLVNDKELPELKKYQ
jgi:hypothetical protein